MASPPVPSLQPAQAGAPALRTLPPVIARSVWDGIERQAPQNKLGGPPAEEWTLHRAARRRCPGRCTLHTSASRDGRPHALHTGPTRAGCAMAGPPRPSSSRPHGPHGARAPLRAASPAARRRVGPRRRARRRRWGCLTVCVCGTGAMAALGGGAAEDGAASERGGGGEATLSPHPPDTSLDNCRPRPTLRQGVILLSLSLPGCTAEYEGIPRCACENGEIHEEFCETVSGNLSLRGFLRRVAKMSNKCF